MMLDRKGDLATYADPDSWPQAEPGGPTARARRAKHLRSRLTIQVFTPGDPTARPIGFSLIPSGLAKAPQHEQSMLAQRAAGALASMMDFRGASAGPKSVILAKAIEVLGSLSPHPDAIGLKELIEFIASDDPNLVNAIGLLDTKHGERLVQDLELLRLSASIELPPTSKPPSPLWRRGGNAAQGGRYPWR